MDRGLAGPGAEAAETHMNRDLAPNEALPIHRITAPVVLLRRKLGDEGWGAAASRVDEARQ